MAAIFRIQSLTTPATCSADSRAAALFLRHSGICQLARGDTATARLQLEHAMRVIDSIPEVVAPLRRAVHDGYFTYLVTLQQLPAADSLAVRDLSHLSGRDRGLDLALAHFKYGYTRAMLHDLSTGEAHLRRAEVLYRSSGVVNATTDTLIRANLAAVYARLGKTDEAARYLKSLTPVQQEGIARSAARAHAADSAAQAARSRAAATR